MEQPGLHQFRGVHAIVQRLQVLRSHSDYHTHDPESSRDAPSTGAQTLCPNSESLIGEIVQTLNH